MLDWIQRGGLRDGRCRAGAEVGCRAGRALKARRGRRTRREEDVEDGEEDVGSPLVSEGGSVGPGGGRRSSNGLAASNLGQGTGGTKVFG